MKLEWTCTIVLLNVIGEKSMKLEPLQQKRHQIEKQVQSLSKVSKNNSFDEGYHQGIERSFDTFVSLINQYKRYKDEVKLLMEEQKPLWKEWVQYYDKQGEIPQAEYLVRYNSWLFDYLFRQRHNEHIADNSLFQM